MPVKLARVCVSQYHQGDVINAGLTMCVFDLHTKSAG